MSILRYFLRDSSMSIIPQLTYWQELYQQIVHKKKAILEYIPFKKWASFFIVNWISTRWSSEATYFLSVKCLIEKILMS